MKSDLILAVVQQANKRRKLNTNHGEDHDMGVSAPPTSSSFVPIDWEEVANKVGQGASAEECQIFFMMSSLKEESSPSERPITPDASHDAAKEAVGTTAEEEPTNDKSREAIQEEILKNLVERSDPQVIKEVFAAAMKASHGNLVESQAASLLGLQLTRTVEEARGHEVDLAARLARLVDIRMQKLENRMAMMDDVESILEAEKVALELERRDLYTTRCRHWFGGM
jgi:SWI/SNF related-matrix-associated actin-dependent regulator of chromatin subfamily C